MYIKIIIKFVDNKINNDETTVTDLCCHFLLHCTLKKVTLSSGLRSVHIKITFVKTLIRKIWCETKRIGSPTEGVAFRSRNSFV